MRFGQFGYGLPVWPPSVGLLHPLLEVMLRPREQWSAADWSAYAEHLEHAGYELAELIQRERGLRLAAQRNLSRKKQSAMYAGARGLLEAERSSGSRPKRGRPTGSTIEATAREALEIQKHMATARGSSVTAQAAIDEVRRCKGQRLHRPNENRAVRNAMSKLRNHNKSRR